VPEGELIVFICELTHGVRPDAGVAVGGCVGPSGGGSGSGFVESVVGATLTRVAREAVHVAVGAVGLSYWSPPVSGAIVSSVPHAPETGMTHIGGSADAVCAHPL
jgi:hypothetical protein